MRSIVCVRGNRLERTFFRQGLCPFRGGSSPVAEAVPIAVRRELHSKNAVAPIEVAFDLTALQRIPRKSIFTPVPTRTACTQF